MSKSDRSEANLVVEPPRSLRQEERDLIVALLQQSPKQDTLIRALDTALVQTMNDGGMGSLRFVASDPQRALGKTAAEGDFLDEDGVAVSAAVNLDRSGQLFELDLWKIDFSPLRRYPRADQVHIRPWGKKRRVD